MEQRRTQIVNELFATEKQYVQDLLVVKDLYLVPIKAQNLLSKGEMVNLFSNIESIIQLHQDLLDSLISSIDPQIGLGIGQIFLNRIERFKLYTAYCSNQSFLVSRMAQIRSQNKPFAIFLDKVFKNPRCRLLPLESFLILPLQRICKYPLLLKEILATFDKELPERGYLEEAFERLKEAVELVNEKTREVENLQKLMEINSLLENTRSFSLLLPTRRYLGEGQIIYKKQLVTGYLFNDILMLTKPSRKGKMSFIHSIVLQESMCVDQSELLFDMHLRSGGIITLTTSSAEDKKLWVDLFRLVPSSSGFKFEESIQNNTHNTNTTNTTNTHTKPMEVKISNTTHTHYIEKEKSFPIDEPQHQLLTQSCPSTPTLPLASPNLNHNQVPVSPRRPSLFNRTLSFKFNHKMEKKSFSAIPHIQSCDSNGLAHWPPNTPTEEETFRQRSCSTVSDSPGTTHTARATEDIKIEKEVKKKKPSLFARMIG